MNKIVVIYKSKYGTTKKYAQWIADELNADLYEVSNIKTKMLKQYSTIIYGGALFAGGVYGISFIKNNIDYIINKQLIVFTCGLADTKNPKNIENITNSLDKVFSPEIKKRISFFHLRGGIDYSKLSLKHKVMMSMLKNQLSKEDFESLKDEDKEFLNTYGKIVDFTDKTTILPIVKLVKIQ